MNSFPLFMTVENKSILVFGGGADAAAKLRLVLKTSATVFLITPEFDPLALAPGRAVHIPEHPLTAELPPNVAFAYAATGDAELDAKIAQRLRGRNIPVCAADQPAVSDFTTPALVDRDPVVVAIGTEGTAPVLARAIKTQVEDLLAVNLGKIARRANALRPWVAEHVPGGAARRLFWQRFFRAGPDSQAAANALAERLSRKTGSGRGKASFIAAGTGADAAELLTLKAAKALDSADVVIFEASTPRPVPDPVLERARREALMVPFAETASHAAVSTGAAKGLLRPYLKQGAQVVWLQHDLSTIAAYAGQCALECAPFGDIETIPGVTVQGGTIQGVQFRKLPFRMRPFPEAPNRQNTPNRQKTGDITD